MLAAVIAACAVSVVLAVVLVLVLRMQADERSTWTEERRVLVDRAIARHTGEVIALDRQAKRAERDEDHEPRIAVGL